MNTYSPKKGSGLAFHARGVFRWSPSIPGFRGPGSYGIRYVPMPSYPRCLLDAGFPPIRYLVVSATLLAGLYVPGDLYAKPQREAGRGHGGLMYLI